MKLDPKRMRRALGVVKGFFAAKIMGAEFCKPLPYPETVGYLEFVAVEEAHRGKGLAAQMLQAVVAQAGYGEYLLDVTDVNLGAIKCYGRFGFVEVGREKVSFPRLKGFREKVFMKYVP